MICSMCPVSALRQHARQDVVPINKMMLERSPHMGNEDRDERQIQTQVHGLQQFAPCLVFGKQVGNGHYAKPNSLKAFG